MNSRSARIAASASGIVAARLDSLSVGERSLLEDASVVGRSGTTRALAALARTKNLRLLLTGVMRNRSLSLLALGGVGVLVADAAYGVIQLDAEGVILRYNAFEAGLSGLTKQKVVGKNFFTQVAPCTDFQEFHGRFREGVASGNLQCTFRYHFAFKKNPRDVSVSLFYNQSDQTVWVLVQPSESGT